MERRAVVLTLGGSDPLMLSWPLAMELRQRLTEDVDLHVVMGGAAPHHQNVKDLATQMRGISVYVDPPVVADIFARAGLAVTAGGGTAGELMAMGIPVMCVLVADNQQAAAQHNLFPVLDGRVLTPNLIADRVSILWCDRNWLK